MKYQIILQYPTGCSDDYDYLIAVEDKLMSTLDDDASVDGHDSGSEQMNIFILTDTPDKVIEDVKKILSTMEKKSSYRIAYRLTGEDDFTMAWPPTLKHFEVL